MSILMKMKPRMDNWTSMLVNTGLRMEKRQGIRFMASQGVPLIVAKRVWLFPDLRREYEQF